MEYSYLIGHKVKINYFNNFSEQKMEFIGSVSKVIIDNNEEKIYIIENGRNIEWIKPNHPAVIELHIEILNKIKVFTKFTRFEIMEI